MMRFFVVGFLLAAHGLRQRSRASVGAANGIESSVHWTADAIPGLFKSASVSINIPGRGETHFDVRTSRSASFAADVGLQVLEGSDGVAELTAVKQSSGFIAGSIVDPKSNIVHQFSGKEGGELRFRSTPGADFPDEADPVEFTDFPDQADSVEFTAAAGSVGTGAQVGKRAAAAGSVATGAQVGNSTAAQVAMLDTMVLWTRDAECKNAGRQAGCTVSSDTQAQMLALVQLAIEETNQAFAISRINAQVRLVHYYRANYQETTCGPALAALQTNGDGVLDQVHAERHRYGADMVAMLTDCSDICGVAPVGPHYAQMFSITAWGCATGYYSFAHEIGHTLGLMHDRGSANSGNGACGSSDFNYGWRDPQGAFRTILAYECNAAHCDMAAPVNSCPRVKHFSNPDVSYNGKTTGSRYANAAWQINTVAASVAAYATAGVTPTPAPGCVNTWDQCAAAASLGWCSPDHPNQAEHQFTLANCCDECRFRAPVPVPPPPAPTPCQDDPEYQSSCPGWASAGYCSFSSEYYQFMQDHCCQTCRNPTPTPAPTSAPTAAPTAAPTQAPQPPPASGCQDTPGYQSSCPGWAAAGYCSPSSENYQFMQDHCCDTCGFGCQDLEQSCGYWAGLGYCSPSSEHYAYMMENCCSSCSR